MKNYDRPSNQLEDASIFFDGSRLTLARHLAGLRKSELASKISKSATAVAAWETGAKRPTPGTLAELALGLAVEPGFFAVRRNDIAAQSTTPHFRSLRSTSQLARDQAFAYGQLSVEVASSIEMHVEFPEVDVPPMDVSIDDNSNGPEASAMSLREAWAIGDGPIDHLIRLAENHGILVVFSPARTASVDAYSFENHLRPIVVLNPTKRDYYRQRFDLAHEIGHLVMHSDSEPGGRIVEDQANRFAAEFLMPSSQVVELLPTTMGRNAWANLRRLKEHWGVSIQALLFQSRRHNRLSDISYRNAMTYLSAKGWRRNEPGNRKTIEQPSLLPKAIQLLAQEGIDEQGIVGECQVPLGLFRTITSRTPESCSPEIEIFSRLDNISIEKGISLLRDTHVE